MKNALLLLFFLPTMLLAQDYTAEEKLQGPSGDWCRIATNGHHNHEKCTWNTARRFLLPHGRSLQRHQSRHRNMEQGLRGQGYQGGLDTATGVQRVQFRGGLSRCLVL